MAKSKKPNDKIPQREDKQTNKDHPVEIPMVHNLEKAFQKEVPMVHNLYKIIPSIEKNQTFLDCYINALVKYHLACAEAGRKFAADIAICNRKRISTPARSRIRKKR